LLCRDRARKGVASEAAVWAIHSNIKTRTGVSGNSKLAEVVNFPDSRSTERQSVGGEVLLLGAGSLVASASQLMNLVLDVI
jgi:hypothetical protein